MPKTHVHANKKVQAHQNKERFSLLEPQKKKPQTDDIILSRQSGAWPNSLSMPPVIVICQYMSMLEASNWPNSDSRKTSVAHSHEHTLA